MLNGEDPALIISVATIIIAIFPYGTVSYFSSAAFLIDGFTEDSHNRIGRHHAAKAILDMLRSTDVRQRRLAAQAVGTIANSGDWSKVFFGWAHLILTTSPDPSQVDDWPTRLDELISLLEENDSSSVAAAESIGALAPNGCRQFCPRIHLNSLEHLRKFQVHYRSVPASFQTSVRYAEVWKCRPSKSSSGKHRKFRRIRFVVPKFISPICSDSIQEFSRDLILQSEPLDTLINIFKSDGKATHAAGQCLVEFSKYREFSIKCYSANAYHSSSRF